MKMCTMGYKMCKMGYKMCKMAYKMCFSKNDFWQYLPIKERSVIWAFFRQDLCNAQTFFLSEPTLKNGGGSREPEFGLKLP